MAHTLKISMPSAIVLPQKTDVIFDIDNGTGKLGQLQVSTGSIVWFPNKAKRGHRLTWEQFGVIAQQFSKQERR